jgi:hypothetical protein
VATHGVGRRVHTARAFVVRLRPTGSEAVRAVVGLGAPAAAAG